MMLCVSSFQWYEKQDWETVGLTLSQPSEERSISALSHPPWLTLTCMLPTTSCLSPGLQSVFPNLSVSQTPQETSLLLLYYSFDATF